MSSKKKKIAQQVQQSKINKINAQNKKYNREMSKSQKDFINGNYVSSVNKTVYGVKKSLAKGEKVHGYGDDYVDTKGMKRSRYLKKQNGENPYEATKLYVGGKPKYVEGGTRADGSKYDGFYTQTRALTKEEKESYKNTGQLYHPQYKKKKEYDLWGSHKGSSAEKFGDHFNLFTLDGMRTAKENQREGKHLQNLAEYGKGFLKDTVGDLAFDALKGFGAIGSTVASGLGGIMEDTTNVMSGIADQRHGIKDYTQGRINTIENLKENKKMLDETGWGLDFTKMLNDASDRSTEKQVAMLEKEGRYEDAKAFKEDKEKTRERDRAWLNSAGFVMDLLAPSTIEDKIGGAIKVLGKNSIKSFNDMRKGTADLAVGFKAGASDDIFFSGKKGTTAIDKKLDDEYGKRFILDEVKEKHSIPNTVKYLNKIITKNDTAYSKYMDEIQGVASDLRNKKSNVKIDGSSKYELPSSNYNVDDTGKRVDPTLKKYDYDRGGRYDDIDYDEDFLKEVDHWQDILDKDPDNRLKNIERMKKYNKEVYNYLNKMVDDSMEDFNVNKFLDEIRVKSNSVDVKPNTPNINTPNNTSIEEINNLNRNYNKFNEERAQALAENKPFNSKNIDPNIKNAREGFSNVTKQTKQNLKNIVAQDNIDTENAIEKILNIMNKTKPQAIPNTSARKFEFSNDINSLSRNLLDGKIDIEEFRKIKDQIVGKNISTKSKVEFINNNLFGGKKVLTRSASTKSIDNLLNSIDEIVEVKKVIDDFYETGEILPIKLSKETRKFLDIPTNKSIKITDTKLGGKIIKEPIDFVNALTDTLINKSGSLVDARYWEKQQLLANKYGYEKVEYVKNEFEEIGKKLKALDKQQMTPSVLAQKQELSARRKQLKELLDNRQADWENILRNMNEATFDNYIQKEYPDIMKKIDLYSKQSDPVNVHKLSNQINVDRAFKELVNETAEANKGKRLKYEDFVKEQYATMTAKDKQLSDKQWQWEINRRWNEYKLELDGAVDERNMELVRGEKMRNQLREGSSSVKNNNVGQNSRARQEMLSEVGAHVVPEKLTPELHQIYSKKMAEARKVEEEIRTANRILNHKVDNIRKAYNLPKPKVNTKIKLTKGQKFKDLPPVMDNLKNLRTTIQKEIRYMYENPESYNEFKDAFKQVKLDYVNSLRAIGVPDDKYFHKVTALQDELMSKMKAIEEQGNTPLLKMEIQKLARKVDDTFNSFDDVVIDNIDEVGDDIGTEIGSMLRQNQDNAPQIKNNSRFSDESFNSFTDIQKNIVNMPIDEIKSKGNQLEDMINAMKKQGVPYEEYADLEDTLRFADEVLKLQNSSRLNIKRATFGMPKFDGSVNPFAPIKDSERLIHQVDNVVNDVNSLIPKKNTPLDNVAPYVDDMEDILGVDQYLSPETKSILNKNAITERSREFLESTKKDPKGKQLSFDGRTLNKKYTQLKNTPKDIVPYNTPLDEIADNGSEQVNMLEYMFNKNKPKNTPKIAPNDVIPHNKQSDALEGVSKTFEGKGNTKFNDDVIELSDSQYKIYDELLSLGHDKDFAKKMAYNITSEKEYSEWLKTMGYNTGDGFEKLNEKLNMDSSEKMREQIAKEKDVVKKRATLDPRTEERLKYYEENFGEIPKPRDFFDDIELPPGVDEDGVIQGLDDFLDDNGVLKNADTPLDEIASTIEHKESPFKERHIDEHNNGKSNKLPTLEEFKKFFVGDSSKTGDNEIKDMYKRWLNSYKKGLTVYNPGWWGANFLQNKGQNFLALGADAFMPQTEAKNIIRKMKGRNYKDVNVFDSKNKISYSMDDITRLAQEFGVIDGLGEDVRNARGLLPKLETQIDNSGFMKRLGEIEETARMHHFVKQLEKGMSPEQASKSVNKYLFDYSQKSDADKFINDYIDPFWTFHKNNARLMATSAIEHGGKLSKIAKGKRNLDQGIPEEQQQNENSKYGKIQMPGTTIKDSKNGDDYNYLYSEGVMPDIEGTFSLSNDSFENKLNPILRLMLQQSRGEGNFGNKIVEEGEEPGWNEITKEDRFGEVMQELNPFMPTLAKTYFKSKDRQQKADEGKQSQEMTDRQQLLDWINYITGNKGNYYRNLDF